MEQPTYRPLPSQVPEKDFIVPSSLHGLLNSVASGDSVGSASALHTPLGGEVARSQGDHPCLTDNNSIEVDNQELKYRKERKKREENFYKEKIQPTLSGYQNKSQQVLQNQIEKACREHGHNSMAVIHLTFGDDVSYPEAQKRINSLRTNVLSQRYRIDDKIYVLTICEKGSKNGRVHFHVLVIKDKADFRTGTSFYWCPNAKKEKIRANKELREEWDFYRDVLPKYGLGDYVRIEPLKSVEGGARYFSKYVGKGHYSRDDSMVSKQLIRPSNGFRQYFGTKEIDGKKWTAHQQVNWIGGVSAGRRIVVGDVGATYLCHDLEALNYKLGSQWQHYAKDQMRLCSCLAGNRSGSSFRLGPSSKEFLSHYAKNVLGVDVVYALHDDDRVVVGGHRNRKWIPRVDLYELAFDHLLDRLEVVEEFQYDERTPVVQRVVPNNEKNKPNEIEYQRNEPEPESGPDRGGANENLTFPWG